jgi:adenine-specific DNA-methyltransferase
MAVKTQKTETKKTVVTLTHEEASRKNIPTAEYQSVMRQEEQSPVRVAYERRNRDLDPQLVWRGKDEQDWSDLVVPAPPLYIQEKVHPKALVDDLLRRSQANVKPAEEQINLFADFNGLPTEDARTEFYQHDANWSNRMILGDSLQVMASLAEREGLRGQVQCIYIDPPYGIKFNSNFQWSTTSRDFILFYAKDSSQLKYRPTYREKTDEPSIRLEYRRYIDEKGVCSVLADSSQDGWEDARQRFRLYRQDNIVSQRPPGSFPVAFRGQEFRPLTGYWKTGDEGMKRLVKASRVEQRGRMLSYVRFLDDYSVIRRSNYWPDTKFSSRAEDKTYVVQTSARVIERCVLMATDPGDLVLDPTCGSGTTAYVAEQRGRRWITVDTSRVALALTRARIMGARYPYYLLADSRDGQIKEGEVARKVPSEASTHGNIRQGFVYERVPHVTLKSIANNAEIDVIWDKFQQTLEPLRQQLNTALKQSWEEWQISRDAEDAWPKQAKTLHAEWWQQRIARQKEIDASIAAKAEYEYLYDKPYEDNKKVRVAGPFTVESLSPHRVLAVDENDELIDWQAKSGEAKDFVQVILENLKTAGVQQAHKEDKISFSSVAPWPGSFVCAEGRFIEGEKEKRAAIFIGPEFGTVSRPDLVAAAREAGDANFDVLIACAFNYDAHSSEFNKLGRIPVLKARMNADLHMAEDLKNTGKGNLFVIFGEPDIEILDSNNGRIQVKIKGVDVFHPNTGEVRSDGAEGIACWFIDSDYNEESFFVRHAYFLGANDPYKSLKTTLKAEINEEVWATLNSDTSRPFDKPKSGRIAVKVINHLGDEVMKVFRVS